MAPDQAHRLALAIGADRTFRAKGFACTLGEPGVVLVMKRGHVRGLWRWTGQGFEWFDAGSNAASQSVATVEEAVEHLKSILG